MLYIIEKVIPVCLGWLSRMDDLTPKKPDLPIELTKVRYFCIVLWFRCQTRTVKRIRQGFRQNGSSDGLHGADCGKKPQPEKTAILVEYRLQTWGSLTGMFNAKYATLVS